MSPQTAMPAPGPTNFEAASRQVIEANRERRRVLNTPTDAELTSALNTIVALLPERGAVTLSPARVLAMVNRRDWNQWVTGSLQERLTNAGLICAFGQAVVLVARDRV